MMNNYYDMATQTGGRFVQANNWLGAGQVLFMRRLVSTTCKKTWEEVAQRSSEVNLWEHHALQCKARRALASHLGMHIDNVSIEMVEQTPEGVQGWADVVTTAAARGQKGGGGVAPRNKAKPKAKPKSSPGDGGSVQALEKEAKGLLAKDMQARCDFNAFKDKLQPIEAEANGSTAWAQPYISQVNDAFELINVFRTGSDFLQKFERCVLSPENLKKLKKDMGSEYHTNLVRLKDSLAEPLNTVGEQIAKMQNMALAAHPEQLEVVDSKKKRPRKS